MTSFISSPERTVDACQNRLARIDALLADASHHIEFNGHLTNHNKHAVVALAGLNASAERIEAYYRQYAHETTYGFGLEPKRPSRVAVTQANCLSLRGQRTSFSSLCEFFDAAIARDGLDAVLARWMPELLPGWAGAFTHATIHLGWGLDYGHPRMITEGLAYMVFSWVSCHPQRQHDSERVAGANAIESLIAVVKMLEQDPAAFQAWAAQIQRGDIAPEKAQCHPELKRSGLQYRVAMALAQGHPLMDATPGWLLNASLDDVWLGLHYCAAIIYLARPGDFVNLHLITSLHAMEEIASRLPMAQRRSVARCFWQGMLGILFSSGDVPDSATLANLHARWRAAVDNADAPAVRAHWEETIQAAIAEAEEHNPKLVYVAQKLWRRTGYRSVYRAAASFFTTTPALPPSFDEMDADSGI
ncbi:questin oxidase family protein [Enterobacteriaceae bacterium YMB-R22]|jgi:hypothetical protein|uniref:questin oxidase family protein n=1 Tax=Tenebrionicola larvae TaxID=2815733 RepID=UPI0020123347|nr:questin oxidase family protein [Tenebrionicola larvae]MBV4412913.1 questin oxidase family protein [Tenebrionicola larvae]